MRLRRVLAWSALGMAGLMPVASMQGATEAPTGFDNLTNGFIDQGTYDAVQAVFDTTRSIPDGLGPVYNARSCTECHQNPVNGGISQVSNLRAGHFNGSSFVDHPGGSLISDRAIDPLLQERLLGGNEVRAFRASLNTLGDGFVECIDSNTLIAISIAQPASVRGVFVQVPVEEAPGANRGGRFGWKDQHASLRSFAADEYLDQIGITNPLRPIENTSNGRPVAAFDAAPDPEDDGTAVDAVVAYLRATKAPPRDTALAATASAQRGNALFNAIGCASCHVPSITTAPAGTVINGGTFSVPAALGDKVIHPYSDFLLHDVGTGDGIVQNGGQGTRNMLRTPPLWGMRTRLRLMHDGVTVSRTDAIQRHRNQGASARHAFRALSSSSQNDLINFLNSL
jgi:CxxC motif-containing protein (DUF1111 family)